MSQPRPHSLYYVRLRKRLRRIGLITAIAATAIALLMLTGGHLYRQVSFTNLFPNPMTVFGLLLAGVATSLAALWPFNRSFILLMIMAAIIIIAAGLIRFTTLAGMTDWKIDLFPLTAGPVDEAMARMSWITAAGFILLGLALLARASLLKPGKWLHYILFALLLVAFSSLLSIIYDSSLGSASPFLSFFKMDTGASACFLLLAVSLLMGECDYGAMAVITSNKTGGRMARLFLPFILLFPLVIGLVEKLAERIAGAEDSVGIALFSLLVMVVFFVIMLRAAQSSNNLHNWLLQEIEERKKAEEEARRSNLFGNTIYENIPSMVFVKEGDDLRYKSINKAGEQLIGHTRQELLGKSDHDFFPKEEADFFRAKDREVFTSDKPVIAEEPITTPDHGLRWLRTKKIGVRDNDGKPLYMIGISEDITELKEKEEKLRRYNEDLEKEVRESTRELRESEERYQRMVEEVQDYAIVMLDPEGRIMHWNKGAERIKGYRSEEIIGKGFEIFYTPKDRNMQLPARLLEEARRTGRASNEGWGVKKDGSYFWAFVVITALHDEQKNLIGFTKVTRDMTETRAAEEQRLEYEKRLRVAINSLGDNAWEFNFTTDITTFSDTIRELLGYTAQEFKDDKHLWWNITHPQDRWMLEENDRQYRNGEIDHHVSEYRVFHKDGSVKWILDRGVVVDKTATNAPLRIVGIHMDITTRKEAENRIIENELRFRDLTQNVPGVIYQWIERPDGSFGFTYVSPKLREYFGIEPEEMHNLVNYVHPEDKERWRGSIEESKAKDVPWFFEGRFLFPDGRISWWRGSSVIAMRNETGAIYNGILLDITAQKLTEEKIIKDQKRYEAVFNSQYQFMGLTSPQGILEEVNQAILDFAGVEAQEVIGRHCWECYWWTLSPAIRQRLRESTARAAAGEFIRYETDIIGKGGKIATIDFSIKPVFDNNGDVLMLISEGRDITERKLLERKAKEQEEQIRLFVKHTPAAVAMFDNQLRYMLASDRWYRDYGLEGKDIIGQSHYEIFPEIANMEEWKAIHRHCLAGAVELREQDPFHRADGTIDWLRWEIYPWRTANDRIGGIIMFTEVITDRIRAREQLETLNKRLTESNRELEQFAYVASHDLQEPLRMVSSFLQLLEKKYKDQLDEKASQYIHFAVDGAERMKSLIDDLLKFSRVGTASYKMMAVDCNEVVENVIRVYDHQVQAAHAVVKVTRLPVIHGNKTQLEQLFQNLVGNALKYRGPEPPLIEIGCNDAGNEWICFVKDNGIGIDSKFFDKVFIIFQRLHGKNEYSGTGIGLAICKKIVERHGGRIWIASMPGKGATFYFSFPKNQEHTG